MIYKGSNHGFTSEAFHQQCDVVSSPTLSLIKSNIGSIFGGYTVLPWQSEGGPKADNQSFICSFTNNLCFHAQQGKGGPFFDKNYACTFTLGFTTGKYSKGKHLDFS